MKVTDRLKIAGKELIRGNIGNAVKSITYVGTIDPLNYKGGGFTLFLEDGTEHHFDYTNSDSSLKAYRHCPPIAAIINKKAKAFSNGKPWVLNSEGDKKGKEATTKEAIQLRKLLAQPNALLTWKSFETHNYIFQQLFGYCVVLAIKPTGFPNIAATSLWNIAPCFLDIREKQNINLATVKNIKDVIESITIKGLNTPLDLNDIYIFKDDTPGFKSLVIPEGRVESLTQPISNIIGTLESRGVLIDKRGPSYVIGSGESDELGQGTMTAIEKKEVQEEFKKYGLRKKQVQAIITSANVKVQTIGFSTRDLMLFEEMEDDIMRICDSYGMPHRLIASNRNNSLGGSDAEYFNRQLYQDTIIPEGESIYQQWDQFFELAKYNLTLNKDYSHIPSLQADKVKEAQARNLLNDAKKKEFDAGICTLDQWLAALGEDPLPDGKGQVRVTDLKKSDVPLAVTIGVGGVQSLIQLLTAKGMTEEARRNAIEIVFGIPPADAARMVVGSDTTSTEGDSSGNNANNSGNGN